MKTEIRRSFIKFFNLVLILTGIIGLAVLNAEAKREASISETPLAVSAVTSETLSDKWNLPRGVNELSQLTPGLNTTTTQSNAVNIRIRGLTTDRTSALVFVDGQRAVSSLSDINPDDIANINIIRGASATAIYGADAAAGVINIITKSPREKSDGSFVNSASSPFRNDPYQAGYHAMASADEDPTGHALSAFYNSGGSIGADAGNMFATTVMLRYNLGGPLCDLGTTTSKKWQWPSEGAANCLADEMLGYQVNYDTLRGATITNQLGGEFIYSGLTGLGFDQQLATSVAGSKYPGFSPSRYDLSRGSALQTRNFWNFDRAAVLGNGGVEWYETANLGVNPVLMDNFLNYSPGGKHYLPGRDNNRLSLDLSFYEPNFGRDPQEMIKPNDPLYKKPDTAAGKVGGVLKKGFGALLGASGLGIGINDNDSESDDQWSLHAVGFTPMGTGTSAWDAVDGRRKNVVVAVIDSGLDLSHPDRPSHIWRNQDEIPNNNIDDDTNGYVDDINGWNFVDESKDIDDDYGHGTFVAGIIAANTDNGEGIAGINPGARVMTLKVSNKDGLARSLAIYRALRYAVDNGARVINISLGRKGLSRLEQIGINYAYAMGCVVVVAAGNQGSNIANYGPPGARRVFSVSSLNVDGSRRSQSNKGLMVAVAAPGESIYSLTAKNGKRDGRIIPIMAGDYHRLNGTSFAAPIVAGTASLILAKYPYLSNYEVEDMILASAVDAEEPGWDSETGMGKLDARRALSISPQAAFAPRITEWIMNRDKRGKITSVDVYGVIRGPVGSYEIAVGQGSNPSNWTPVFGPANHLVQHGHITRIPGSYFNKGSSWSLRLMATALDGNRRIQKVRIRKER